MHASGKSYTLNAPLDTIPLMIRGGSIIPAQEPSNTTVNSRKNSFELLIALDYAKRAKGELYWDDGDSLGIAVISNNNCRCPLNSHSVRVLILHVLCIDSFEKGQFIWLLFAIENDILRSTRALKSTFAERLNLDKVQIWGVTSNVSRVSLNNREIQFEYDNKRNVSFSF